MLRIARVVVPGEPHHITQRDNRRQRTFFGDEDYPWSSAAAHLRGEDDLLTRAAPLLELAADWSAHLAEDGDESTLEALRRHERTGRPLGSEEFVTRLEERSGRELRPRRPGRKRKGK